ncbi:MAG: nucleotidyltransferase domain-containing protein [Nitrososphaerales archaeon]
MEKYVDILFKRVEMIKNWKEYVINIYFAVKKILPNASVYIFGSVVKNEIVGGSDIDILIISKSIQKENLERVKIKRKIEELTNLPPYHPFEFHIVNEDEAKLYFKKIKELKRVNDLIN